MQLVVSLIADPGVVNFILAHSPVEIDHQIFSVTLLLIPLIYEGLVSVTRESMCTKYW